MEENLPTQDMVTQVTKTADKKASKVMYFVLAAVVLVSAIVIGVSIFNKNKRTPNNDVQPTPTTVAETPLASETPYPTPSSTVAPAYTNTFEDKTFFWATNKNTNEQGVFFTSPMFRQSNEISTGVTQGAFTSTVAVDYVFDTVSFTDLSNIIRLGKLPSNIPYNTLSMLPGFEKNSYIFTIYDDTNCAYVDNSDKCYQYYYKVIFNADGTVGFTNIRTYTFGVQNAKRKTFGVENLVAVLSPTQLAVDVNYCHWCGLETKTPTIYIVNTKTGNETFMGAIGNIKASTDGKTFTYQKLKQVPYVCPKPADDPTCSEGVYPAYSYTPTGAVLTGKLN